MGIIDLLKDVPLSAVLKEKIITLESENKSLKAENFVLNEKLSQSEEQRRALEQKIIDIEVKLGEVHKLSTREKEARICLFLESNPRSTIKQISTATGITAQEVNDKLEEYSIYNAAKRELVTPSGDALWTLLQNLFKN